MATTDSYGQGVAITALTDAPNAQALAFAIVDALTQRSVMRFASASARAATLTAPTEGMVTYLLDVDSLQMYTGSTWQPLAPQQTGVNAFTSDLTNATTTSTTYVNSSRTLSLTMTAPISGKLEATLSVRCDNSGSFNTLSDLLIVGSTSGTIYSPTDTAATQWPGNTSAGPFITQQQAIAVPGETVTITAQHRVVGATGNMRYRSISAKALA